MILDSIYYIPVILEHLEKPTEQTEQLILKMGIGPGEIEDLHNIRGLLEYHLSIVRNDFKESDYALLLKGLKQYFDYYLSGIWQTLGITDEKAEMLDYGCGLGYYSKAFLLANPDATSYVLDRKINFPLALRMRPLEIDFEAEPFWYATYIDSMDIVLLSEVLHCKQATGQEYLIRSSYEMLRDDSRLIIVEPVDEFMAYRISKLKGEPHQILESHHIGMLVSPYNIELIDQTTIMKHEIYVYQKI